TTRITGDNVGRTLGGVTALFRPGARQN
nr:envelope protein 2 variant 28 [Hepacivirus hominis]MOZ57976.1 envelope protein 2 variant 181 [Hepacivirus hominis]MOZ57977.1 envelope protein 2 variant 182 [Hepacivirus hominis]MOZ58050.1 envelope protein 2 variant 255 [Hepacivirus hominis]MOZ58277.1 envelope protein 2 variant 482 [Hepacivirus hominis]